VGEASKLKDASAVAIPGGGLAVVAARGAVTVWSMTCSRPAREKADQQSRAQRHDDCESFHEKLPSVGDSP
jgi:hypothetical protein